MSIAHPTPRQCLKVVVVERISKLNWAVYSQSFIKVTQSVILKNFALLRDPGAGLYISIFSVSKSLFVLYDEHYDLFLTIWNY